MTRAQKVAIEKPLSAQAIARMAASPTGVPAPYRVMRDGRSIIVAIEEDVTPQAIIPGWSWHASIRSAGAPSDNEAAAAAELEGVGEGPVMFERTPSNKAAHAFKRISAAEMALVEQALRRSRS